MALMGQWGLEIRLLPDPVRQAANMDMVSARQDWCGGFGSFLRGPFVELAGADRSCGNMDIPVLPNVSDSMESASEPACRMQMRKRLRYRRELVLSGSAKLTMRRLHSLLRS
jgi:hypothetical protein